MSRKLFCVVATLVFHWKCLDGIHISPYYGQHYDATDNLSGQRCRTVCNKMPYECPVERYNDFTCIACYMMLPEGLFVEGMFRKYLMQPVGIDCQYKMHNLTQYYHPGDYDYKNESSAISRSVTATGKRFWSQCCDAAIECCERMLSTPSKPRPDGNVCPPTFDGWQCFDEIEAGGTLHVSCPEHIQFEGPLPCQKTFTRTCGENGTWPMHNNRPGTEYTDYNSCVLDESVRRRHQVHVAAFFVSAFSLIPAIIIFFSYKQLKIASMVLHRNLFFSFLVSDIALIVFTYLVTIPEDADIISGSACRFLYALTKYTRLTNYTWMMCEGFYLHKRIVFAFSKPYSIIVYYILGWGVAVIPPLVYSVIRIVDTETDTQCWGKYPVAEYEWAITGPIVGSLVINACFLLNIIRILITQLRTSNTNNPNKQHRKAVRATLLLVPLFGLHFFVTAYKPTNPTCFWLDFYYYVAYIIDGAQGFFVALIFCYLNGEVLFLLRRSYRQWQIRRNPESGRGRPSSDTVVSAVGPTMDSSSSNRPAKENETETRKTEEPDSCTRF